MLFADGLELFAEERAGVSILTIKHGKKKKKQFYSEPNQNSY